MKGEESCEQKRPLIIKTGQKKAYPPTCTQIWKYLQGSNMEEDFICSLGNQHELRVSLKCLYTDACSVGSKQEETRGLNAGAGLCRAMIFLRPWRCDGIAHMIGVMKGVI